MGSEVIQFKINDINEDQRWAWFIQKIDNATKKVTAYFCQKGQWPVYYSGKLKYLLECWYLTFNIDVNSPPMMEVFAKQVFDLEKESEVDS